MFVFINSPVFCWDTIYSAQPFCSGWRIGSIQSALVERRNLLFVYTLKRMTVSCMQCFCRCCGCNSLFVDETCLCSRLHHRVFVRHPPVTRSSVEVMHLDLETNRTASSASVRYSMVYTNAPVLLCILAGRCGGLSRCFDCSNLISVC